MSVFKRIPGSPTSRVIVSRGRVVGTGREVFFPLGSGAPVTISGKQLLVVRRDTIVPLEKVELYVAANTG